MVRLFIFLIVLSTFNLNAGKNNKKPNFLFVLVDDQPYDAIGFSKRYPFLKTPNIDKLASEGVNIKNFFVTQSICSPSRASFLTGTYPHIHGVNQNNKHSSTTNNPSTPKNNDAPNNNNNNKNDKKRNLHAK